MNFKDWMKLKEDNKTCTLKHPSGHVMTIALKALPKIQQEQIKRLKFAGGGKVDEIAKRHYEEGTPDGTVSKEDMAPPPDTQAQAPAPITIINNPTPQGQAQPPALAPQSQPQPVQAQAQTVPNLGAQGVPEQITPGPAPQAENLLNSDQSLNVPKAVESSQKAEAEKVPIAAEKAKQDIQKESAMQSATQNLAGNDVQAIQHMRNQTDAFAHDMLDGSAKLKPLAYAENMKTPQKVATAIGMIIGGFGTPFGGTNYAYDFLNKQIDRDIDAQKFRSDQERTVWGAYNSLYGNENIANNLAKVSLNNMYVHQGLQDAARRGTAEAAQAAHEFGTKKALENEALLKDSAARLGTLRIGGGSGTPSPQAPGTKNNAMKPKEDRILTPAAQSKYDWAMNKYNTVQSPEEKAAIIKEYGDAYQADRALDQIDELYPQLMEKRTYGGYLADKINPAVVGGMGALAAEGIGVLGAPVTGGASLAAAIPGAMAAGAGATAGAAALKTGLRALGGQTQTQYDTAANSLKTIIGSALGPAGITPTEKEKIAEEFFPTQADSEKTAKDKLEKLKKKIIAITKTPTLNSKKVTNER